MKLHINMVLFETPIKSIAKKEVMLCIMLVPWYLIPAF